MLLDASSQSIKRKRALTLLEVIACLVILGFLTAFVAVKSMDMLAHYRAKEQVSMLKTELDSVFQSVIVRGGGATLTLKNLDDGILLTAKLTSHNLEEERIRKHFSLLTLENNNYLFDLGPDGWSGEMDHIRMKTPRGKEYQLYFNHLAHSPVQYKELPIPR